MIDPIFTKIFEAHGLMPKTEERTFNNKQLSQIETLKVCIYCEDLDEIEFEAPDEPHHGEEAICGECNAEYYEEWGGTRYACNEKAEENHPELKTI